jgi:putative addiction module component (TIGR02574 family)
MARTAEDLYSEALELPEAERVRLADLLAESVDALGVEQAWLDEARLRVEEIDNGTVVPVPNDEVFAKLRIRNASE